MLIPEFSNTYAALGASFSTALEPTPVPSPELVKLNDELANLLGFEPADLASEKGVNMLAGNESFEGMAPLAAVYAGHQFGQFNPQLGDGRAILLGEVVTSDKARFDVQLKGAGQTPYSRGGDGRAPLGPVLREYLVSEAMHALGVPSTRSLAAVTTGELVYREEPLHGAVLTRVASSHIRIGTFQYFAAKGMRDELKQMADYVIQRHYPEAAHTAQPYVELLIGVAKNQASLIAKWQQLGFIHGVMNTDNVLLSGETIDYGPCAFLDVFNPEQVFSSIDRGGRYAYQNQPSIAHWNIMNFAQTLLPLIDEDTEKAVESAQQVVDQFQGHYQTAYQEGMNRKLGLASDCVAGAALSDSFLALLAEGQCDFTLAFRRLSEIFHETLSGSESAGAAGGDSVSALFEFPAAFADWLQEWKQVLREPGSASTNPTDIFKANPVYTPRNHLVEKAILEGYQGNYQVFEDLLTRVTNPTMFNKQDAEYARAPKREEVVRQTFCGT